ncbi:MAG: hypothetical protein J7497_09760, partial [Chitinophagaceae bacterium]|nr:hypothetical protein [Chitinophagaceae bacterium]
IKYTSFEAENNGGWTYSPAGIVATFSPTGKKCYDLGLAALTMTPAQSITKPVLLTLWSTQSQVTINAGTLYQPTKTGPTINGWTYLEFELPSVTGTITVQGTGKVDEVRLAPKSARMTTYTYEPGFGKTSECDANNRIVYYEYDAFGRIKTIKDQYKNLIKAYEYNYKQ